MAAAAALGASRRSAADAEAVGNVVMISVPGPAEAREMRALSPIARSQDISRHVHLGSRAARRLVPCCAARNRRDRTRRSGGVKGAEDGKLAIMAGPEQAMAPYALSSMCWARSRARREAGPGPEGPSSQNI